MEAKSTEVFFSPVMMQYLCPFSIFSMSDEVVLFFVERNFVVLCNNLIKMLITICGCVVWRGVCLGGVCVGQGL